MNEEQKNYRYYAFISYSHADMKWAAWIQRKLESYRLPHYNPQDNIPKKISPIFRDTTDLSVGHLTDNLHSELNESKYLIVVCSPHSAKCNAEGKHYVNEEVKYFCSLGRSAYIIPVIIDGVPNNAEKECFCPQLKELEFVGLDATKFSRPRVLNDIVAKILGLHPDELWQRELRRQKRNRAICIISSLLFFLLLSFSIFLYWDHHRIIKKYYTALADCNGFPEGLGEISKESVKSRFSTFLFQYQGKKSLFGKRILRNVQNINSDFIPFFCENFSTENTKAEFKIIYDEQNRIAGMSVYTKPGELDYTLKYADKKLTLADIITFDKGGDVVTTNFSVNSIDGTGKTGDPVRRVQFLKDKSGRTTGVRYKQGNSNLAALSADGICGKNYILNGDGLIQQERFVDCNGQAASASNRVHKVQYDYCGYLHIRTTFWGIDGQPQNVGINDKAYNRIEYTYDLHGNLITESFHTINASKKTILILEKKYTYSDHGKMQKEETFDNSGKLVSCTEYEYNTHGDVSKIYFKLSAEKKTYKIVCFQWCYFPENQKRLQEQTFFTENGLPCLNEDGFAKIINHYNSQGECTELLRYGTDGHLKGDKNQIAVIHYSYDPQGRLLQLLHKDKNNKPVLNPEGFFKKTSTYSKDDQTQTESYYGIDGQPIILPKFGFHTMVTLLDEQKRVWKVMTFDTEGHLKLNLHGWAIREIKYDKYGNITNEKYYDTNKNLTNAHPRKDVFAAEIRAERNSNGQTLSIGFYGIDGKLLAQPSGSPSFSQFQYDSNQRCIQEEYFGCDKKPFLHKESKAVKIKILYWDSQTVRSKKIYRKNGDFTELKFNRFGKITSEAHFSRDGQLMLDSEGIAYIRFIYNDKQQEIRREFYSPDMQLTLSQQGISGWKSVYNTTGNCIEKSFFGQEMELRESDGVAVTKFFYNKNGIVTKRLFYDRYRKRSNNKYGVSGICTKYDSEGRISEEFYLNKKNEKAINQTTKIAIVRFSYSNTETEKNVKETYYDVSGAPCLNYENIGGRIMKYDSNGNQTETRYIDAAGKPATVSPQIKNNALISGNIRVDSSFKVENVSIIRTKYDSRGNWIFVEFLDKNEKICPVIVTLKNGCCIECKNISRLFSESGLLIEELYELYKPVNKDNIEYIKIVHDNIECSFKTHFLNIKKELAVSKKFGYAAYFRKNDNVGNPIYEAWFNEKKELQNFPNETYAICRYKYNSRNQLTEGRYCNQDDFPVVSKKDGYACIRLNYDQYGRVTEAICLDDRAKLVMSKYGYARAVVTYHSIFNNKRTWKQYNEKNELVKSGISE